MPIRTTVLSLSLLLFTTIAGGAQAQVTLFVTPTNQNGTILTPGTLLSPGDQVQLDIRARNTGGLGIVALGAVATDYGNNGLAFASGETIPQLFAQICDPSIGCVGGLDGAAVVTGPLFERDVGSLAPFVRTLEHISLTPTVETGADDLGVDGTVGSPQSRLFFDVIASTIFDQQNTIRFGTLPEYGDALILADGSPGTSETLWIVPEPGTASLLGLGLLALGRRPRIPGSARPSRRR